MAEWKDSNDSQLADEAGRRVECLASWPSQNAFCSLRFSAEDAQLFEKAREVLWPHAIMTQSAVVLSLARMTAEQVTKRK